MTILSLLRLWFGVREPVTQRQYAASGLGLALFKYVAEVGFLYAATGRWLSPIDFLNPSIMAKQRILEGGPEWLGWALFAWNLPFIWIALSMSVRHAAVGGIDPWWGLAVLVPVFGWGMIFALCLMDDRTPEHWKPLNTPDGTYEGSVGIAALKALGLTAAVGLVMFLLCVYLLRSYGVALFFATPLVMGVVAGIIFNRPMPRTVGATLGLTLIVMFAALAALVLFAVEGLICIAMAAPIVMPLVLLGGLLGRAVATAGQDSKHVMPLLIALPLLAGAERLVTRELPEYCVLTTVEVAAPPEAVWPHVVAFTDLPEPEEWFFRIGIACPIRARIDGQGVGAVRHCEFTTGTFVEPITVWDEPRRLAFDVTSQPDPMTELSPWRHVHPPHLEEQSLKSRRGEFRLINLGDGRTRLEGRTWYTFDMHPEGYWTLWSDLSIHKIHHRVLEHVRQLAETSHAAPPKQ